MTDYSPEPDYRSRINILTGAAALIFCIFIPILTSAEMNNLAVNTLDCSVNIEEVWHPQLIDMNRNTGEKLLKKKVRIDTDGNVNLKQRYAGELSSDLNFKDFPFDEQVLHFIIAAYGPDGEHIDFEVDKSFTGTRKEFSIEGWDIELLEKGNLSNSLLHNFSLYFMDIITYSGLGV